MIDKFKSLVAGYRNTPGYLKVALVSVWVGAALLFLMATIGVSEHRSALTTVGKKAAPSVINAQFIRASLAELDSHAANELIAKPGDNMKATKAYEEKRQALARALATAAENITFGQREREQIDTLTDGLTIYHEHITRARKENERGRIEALAHYRHATELMHETLMPAADALDQVNSAGIESTYSQMRSVSRATLIALFTSGGFLLAVLVATQVFLLRRTRRTINPGLAAASVLAALFLAYSGFMLLHSSHQLAVAKQETFPQISMLLRARGAASEAKGQESGWLLDRPQPDTYATAFTQSVERVKALPQSDKFVEFLNVDAQIRQLELAGDHHKAVALSIGKDPGEANYAFASYDSALQAAFDQQQTEFQQRIDSGLYDLRLFGVMAPLVALAIAVLVLLGLRPRIAEYNV